MAQSIHSEDVSKIYLAPRKKKYINLLEADFGHQKVVTLFADVLKPLEIFLHRTGAHSEGVFALTIFFMFCENIFSDKILKENLDF